MRIVALILAMMPFAAHAGDSVPGAALWPEEPAYIVWIDAVDLFPLWRRCGIETPCSVPYQREPAPAPVPLPWTATALALALAGLATVKRKR